MTTHTTGITKVRPTDARWTRSEMEELLAGVRSSDDLRRLDQRGMTPAYAASLEAAVLVSRLMVLLDAAEGEPGTDPLEELKALLRQQVEQQHLVLEKLDALIAILSPRAARLAAQQARAQEEALPPVSRPRTKQRKSDASDD